MPSKDLKKRKKKLKKAAEEFEEIDKKYMKAKHFRQKEFERLYTSAKTTKEIANFGIGVPSSQYGKKSRFDKTQLFNTAA